MNQQEYNFWVKQVEKNIPIKTGGFADYENWYNRALLGRLLANMNIYKPAIILMESVLQEAKLEDKEQYIWILSDLANYYWVANGDKDKSFSLLEKAIASFDKSKSFSYALINRGFLYNQRWQILALLGESAKAKVEIDEIIQDEIFGLKSKATTNSLLFYAYFNLALFAYENSELDQAIFYLRQAYSYSDIENEKLKEVFDLDISKEATVSQLMCLTHRNIQFEA